MTVISITLIPSTIQIISGIPKTVAITVSISSMIFYTLDGTDPDTSSNVYLTPIEMPVNLPHVNLKVFATNGVDSSSILSVTYAPDITSARVSHAVATIHNPTAGLSCGSVGDPQETTFSQPADSPMDAAGVAPVDQDGYGSDPTVYPVRQYDEAIPTYSFEQSDTDYLGQVGRDIGTLPKVRVIHTPADPEQGDMNKATFNPRALVIFYDDSKPNENGDENVILRSYYDGEDLEKSMYGAKFNTTMSSDGDCGPNGGLTRYLYNPRDNSVTFYYYDNRRCRWIVSRASISSMAPSPRQANPLYNFMSPTIGSKFVYNWHLWHGTFIV